MTNNRNIVVFIVIIGLGGICAAGVNDPSKMLCCHSGIGNDDIHLGGRGRFGCGNVPITTSVSKSAACVA